MPGAASQDTQLAQSGRVRVFIQEGVDNPLTPYVYYGCLELNKPTQDLGALEPVYCPDPATRNRWNIVDVIPRTAALPKADFQQHANRFLTDVWMRLRERGCLFNVQAVFSMCDRPDDFSRWEAKFIFGRTKLTKFDLGNLNALDGSKNEIVDITGSLESQLWDFLHPIAFEAVGEVQVVAEIVDTMFYDGISCGDCGVASDGCQQCYALQVANTGSPGLSSQLLYSADGGHTWAAMDIPTLSGLSANRFAAVGGYCVVVSANQLGYHYAKFTDIQAGTINWTLQASGMVAGKAPLCIYSKSPSEVFIGATGGYIYFLSNVGSAVTVLTDGSITTQNINDIHGFGRTIVAVGNANAFLVSQNNGGSFSSITGPAVGQNLTACWAINPQVFFVGANNGRLYVTVNGGTTWTQVVFDAGTFTTIDDIQFYNSNVGYLACEIGGAGRVYRTCDGGNTWQYSGSNIQSIPTNQRINVVAPCGNNLVLAAGRKTIGGDGLLALAS